MTLNLETYQALGLHLEPNLAVNGHVPSDFAKYLQHAGDAPYHPCPEAFPSDDAPRGTITRHADWDQTAIYPGTLRVISVYVPAGLDRTQPANLIVFNDGASYLDPKGAVRAAQVLDSLHASDEIAPTVAVFVNPGHVPTDPTKSRAEINAAAAAQRRSEYDALTPDFGRFIIEEVLPFVETSEGLIISKDPEHRTICGISSGGICAFTVAWQFPDQFRRVLSHCGSFVNILGGHNYAYMVGTTPRKPIRVYLQDGSNDATNVIGDWPLANQTLAKALGFAGYDYCFEYGTGSHNLRHGGAVFADSLRWLWR